MEGSARDLAVARGRRYLELCGVAPVADAELERILDASPAQNGSASLGTVLGRLFDHLERCRARVPPAGPPLHRGSMSYGSKR